MITLSRTSCRKVWAIQEMIVTRLPVAIAPGSDTSAMIAKPITHHIVPTTLVIFPPNVSSAAFICFITPPSVRHRPLVRRPMSVSRLKRRPSGRKRGILTRSFRRGRWGVSEHEREDGVDEHVRGPVRSVHGLDLRILLGNPDAHDQVHPRKESDLRGAQDGSLSPTGVVRDLGRIHAVDVGERGPGEGSHAVGALVAVSYTHLRA